MQRLATLLAIATLSVGCDDAFSPSGVAGTYSLRSVNGVSIPAAINLGGWVTLTFNSGTLTLTEGQTWLFSITIGVSDGTTTVTETDTGSGTFTLVEPNTIRLTDSEDGDVSTGVIDGNRITIIDDGETLIFEK